MRFCCRFIVLYTVLVLAPGASGVVIYDSLGFEGPRFTPGNLHGQDAPPTGQGPWLQGGGSATGVVQTTNVVGGAQAVQITRPASANGDTRWAVLKQVTPAAQANVIDIDVDMNVQQATFNPNEFGPAFGLEAYDNVFGAVPKLIGSVTLDATTGDVLYQQTGTGFLTESGTVLSRGAYHHYKLRLNFGNSTYQVFADGALLRTEPFVDPGIDSFDDAPLAVFAATGTSAATATGTAFFDNYVINQIPEPGAAVMLGWMLAAGLLKRRRLH